MTTEIVDSYAEVVPHLTRGTSVLASALIAGGAAPVAGEPAAAPSATGICVAQVLSSAAEAAALEMASRLTRTDAERLTAEAMAMSSAAARADERGSLSSQRGTAKVPEDFSNCLPSSCAFPQAPRSPAIFPQLSHRWHLYFRPCLSSRQRQKRSLRRLPTSLRARGS